MVHILFVCLGNICRSPMAEAVMQDLISKAGLADQITVDSAGTSGYHIGDPAHAGTRQILHKHNINYHGRARRVTAADLSASNSWIIAMDDSNIRHIKQIAPVSRLHKLTTFAANISHNGSVPDPYYTGDFNAVYNLVQDGCIGLLQALRQEYNID